MASRKLTQYARDRVAEILKKRARDIRDAEILADEHGVALLAYAEIVTDAERRRWQRMDPDGKWVIYTTDLHIVVSGGRRDDVSLPKPYPVPRDYDNSWSSHRITFGNRDNEEIAAAFITRRNERNERLKADCSAIDAALARFTTTTALREGWPDAMAVEEIRDYLAALECDVPPVPVDLSRINAAAGLPPADRKAA